MSDRVTWASCPQCGAWAAVGWRGGTVVEVDCRQQCELTEGQIAEVGRLARRSSVAGPPEP
jgi:hypothetical protein